MTPEKPRGQRSALLSEEERHRPGLQRLDALLGQPEAGTEDASPPAGTREVRLPAVIGCEMLSELGRGGMGVVYKARHLKLNRLVALKMIRHGVAAGGKELRRFKTEAEAVARLQHPNIVQLFEVGEHEGQPFFSLEFCPGGSLETKLQATPLPAREAAALVEKLALGLCRRRTAAGGQHLQPGKRRDPAAAGGAAPQRPSGGG
jgi:hypothetical protein